MQQNAIPTNAESIPPRSLTELEKTNKQTHKNYQDYHIYIEDLTSKQFSTDWIIPPLTASDSKRSLPI